MAHTWRWRVSLTLHGVAIGSHHYWSRRRLRSARSNWSSGKRIAVEVSSVNLAFYKQVMDVTHLLINAGIKMG